MLYFHINERSITFQISIHVMSIQILLILLMNPLQLKQVCKFHTFSQPYFNES